MTRLNAWIATLVSLSCACGAWAQTPPAANTAQWKKDAEAQISRFKTMAMTTSFGGIKVSVPGQFRQWMPVNAAAQAQVAKAQGKPAPPVPPGETPVYIQFTRFGVKGLGMSSTAAPFEWAQANNTPELKLDEHWTLPQVMDIQQFDLSFTVRVGDGRGISPRFDLDAKLQGARVPVDIHALSTTCLKPNPKARSKELRSGKLTLESKDILLPREVQRNLFKSLTDELGPQVVVTLPNLLCQMPTPEQFLKGEVPEKNEGAPSPTGDEVGDVLNGLERILGPRKKGK